MVQLINPCKDRGDGLPCERLGLDKNDRQCMECQRRIDYVARLGCLGSAVESDVDLVGDGGLERAYKNMHKNPIEKRVEHPIILEACEKYKIAPEALKKKIIGQRNSIIPQVREYVVKRLIDEMDETQIGRLLFVSRATIYNIKAKLRKDNTPVETSDRKICMDKNCELGNTLQPIDNFQIHGPSGKRFNICRQCQSRRLRHSKTAAKKRPKNPAQKTKIESRTKIKTAKEVELENGEPIKDIICSITICIENISLSQMPKIKKMLSAL